MALPSSGAISLADVNVELGVASTTTRSLNDSAVRTLFGVASGAIDMATGRGKSNRSAISYTFASNTANASLNLSALGGYNAGKSDITVTINSGVYLYATSTGNYGLNITGGTTGDTLTIVNNGYIMGMGGNGGTRSGGGANVQATSGGPAINFGFSLAGATVTNTSGYIGGGGGGGGIGDYYCGGGGGAGGGTGGNASGGNGETGTGGSGGGVGASGANGTSSDSYDASYGSYAGSAAAGGGGGRIMPGTGGNTFQNGNARPGGGGGAGGAGAAKPGGGNVPGGSAGNAGAEGTLALQNAGGGGGWGASGGIGSFYPRQSGSGGKAINLNAKSITWTGGTSSSSRAYGAVS